MKLGYSTWGMPKVPIDEALAHLAGLGYEGVELTVISGYTTDINKLDDAERERIKELFGRHNLALPAIAAHTSLLETDPEKHAANMAGLREAADLAVQLAQDGEIPPINTTPGGRPSDWDEMKDLLVQRTVEILDYVSNLGVTLAMEGHVGAIIDRPEKNIWLLEKVDSPYLKLNFDISHYDVLGMTIEESVPLLAPHSVHTHVKDQSGRHPNHQFLIPGEGPFDYVRYLKAMREAGYEGFITVEVSKMVQSRPDYDPFAAAELAYRTLSAAFKEAGISR